MKDIIEGKRLVDFSGALKEDIAIDLFVILNEVEEKIDSGGLSYYELIDVQLMLEKLRCVTIELNTLDLLVEKQCDGLLNLIRQLDSKIREEIDFTYTYE